MVKGDYLYRQVLALIDYCGDIRKGKTEYSIRYSPNNIRRLILSPDGAYVMYHINTGVGFTKTVSFNPNLVMECIAQQDYTPMLYVLSADRVCASVEEVVICTGSKSGARLDSRELNFTGLIKSYKGAGKDIKDTIMQRYKRLHAFIQYNGDIGTFLNNTSSAKGALSLLSDTDFVKGNCSIELFNGTNWYKQYGYSAKFYALDRQGSPLNNHFLKVIEDYEKREKDKAKDNFKKERLKGVYDEFDKEYKKLEGILSCYVKLIKQYDKPSIYGIEIPKISKIKLYKLDDYTYKSVFIDTIDEDSKTEDKLDYNIKMCRNMSQLIYTKVLEALINGLGQVGGKYPITVETLLHIYDRAIFVPQNVTGTYASRFSGKRWNDSVANAFVLLGVLTINGFKDINKEVWLSCLS